MDCEGAPANSEVRSRGPGRVSTPPAAAPSTPSPSCVTGKRWSAAEARPGTRRSVASGRCREWAAPGLIEFTRVYRISINRDKLGRIGFGDPRRSPPPGRPAAPQRAGSSVLAGELRSAAGGPGRVSTPRPGLAGCGPLHPSPSRCDGGRWPAPEALPGARRSVASGRRREWAAPGLIEFTWVYRISINRDKLGKIGFGDPRARHRGRRPSAPGRRCWPANSGARRRGPGRVSTPPARPHRPRASPPRRRVVATGKVAGARGAARRPPEALRMAAVGTVRSGSYRIYPGLSDFDKPG